MLIYRLAAAHSLILFFLMRTDCPVQRCCRELLKYKKGHRSFFLVSFLHFPPSLVPLLSFFLFTRPFDGAYVLGSGLALCMYTLIHLPPPHTHTHV
jgi:hypothetical protein